MSSSLNAMIVTREMSDSNSRNELFRGTCTKKRPRSHHGIHAAGYKGVVVQQNGNWGAQIYFNNERIWLGTFKSEQEAAMAYDSAALKLHNGDSDRNFQWTSLTVHEPHFQSRFTTKAVLNMIKDGSYVSQLASYVSTHGKTEEAGPHDLQGGGYFSKQLFQKELTPSDVGKLNRLVIPKKAALKFFPPIPGAEEVQLTFHDRSMRVWKFRYCYWKSSQSFVFTRGWNRFVSINNLHSQDVVIFSLCKWRDVATNDVSISYVIEVSHRNGDVAVNGIGDVDDGGLGESVLVEPANPTATLGFGSGAEGSNGNSENEEKERKGFRLFGVQIL